MERPQYSSLQVYRIMQDCWMLKPEARPDFSQMRELFESQLEASVKDFYNKQSQLSINYLYRRWSQTEPELSSQPSNSYLPMNSMPNVVDSEQPNSRPGNSYLPMNSKLNRLLQAGPGDVGSSLDSTYSNQT